MHVPHAEFTGDLVGDDGDCPGIGNGTLDPVDGDRGPTHAVHEERDHVVGDGDVTSGSLKIGERIVYGFVLFAKMLMSSYESVVHPTDSLPLLISDVGDILVSVSNIDLSVLLDEGIE